MKYSDDAIIKAVSESTNYVQVMRKLGMPEGSGGTHQHVRLRVKRLGCDVSHFKKTAPHTRKSINYKTPETIFVKRESGARTETGYLRRALKESGVPDVCVGCGLPPVWRSKTLVLQVDHKNGDRLDNRKENLRYLCPNCHSQE